ncbi:hypothetical protein [Actinomadura sp. B10D3]|uniref:hypothetical protein n=1 Tax=Actinomadura sp. B10D3 TaxID=3153557 RepID=UPI00325E3F88
MSENREVPPHEDLISYDTARNVLVQLIGHASNRVTAVKGQPEPDRECLNQWEERREGWTARLQNLDPRDMATVQPALREDARFLRSLLKGDAG